MKSVSCSMYILVFLEYSKSIAVSSVDGLAAGVLGTRDCILVNCVCPGHIDTPLTAPLMADAAWRAAMLAKYPLGRFGRVDDVAAAVLYLASDEASWVTGAALPVDGGYT